MWGSCLPSSQHSFSSHTGFYVGAELKNLKIQKETFYCGRIFCIGVYSSRHAGDGHGCFTRKNLPSTCHEDTQEAFYCGRIAASTSMTTQVDMRATGTIVSHKKDHPRFVKKNLCYYCAFIPCNAVVRKTHRVGMALLSLGTVPMYLIPCPTLRGRQSTAVFERRSMTARVWLRSTASPAPGPEPW